MLGNKEIMAKNIRYYMSIKNINAVDICKKLDIKQNTFSNWVNGKIYPRIDKIEKMANFFGVPKYALVEEDGPMKLLNSLDPIPVDLIPEKREFLDAERPINNAIRLYSLYQKASPEARKAVEVLLKFEPPQS